MNTFDLTLSQNAHKLYDEYKKLDKEFYDALNEAKKRMNNPFDDEETRKHLKALDDKALDAFHKWREYRTNHSSKIDFNQS